MYNKSMSIKEKLLKELEQIIKNFGGDFIPSIEFASDLKHGDLTTNAAMILAKTLKKNPIEIAEEIVKELRIKNQESGGLDKIEVVKPGFINFRLSKEYLIKKLPEITAFEKNKNYADKKVMVEFTDPNPFKEFHIGHLYSNIVGEAIAKLLESQGAVVWRVCYQGDVGMHVAKAVWEMINLRDKLPDDTVDLPKRVEILGKAYSNGAIQYDIDVKSKQEIIEINKKIYAKDPEVFEVYQKGRRWSLEYFDSIYQRLGTTFKKFYFESEVGEYGKKFIDENIGKVFLKSDGAIVFPGDQYGLHTRVFINSEGLPTYEAKELGLAPKKYSDFAYDESIIITGNEVNEYFKVLLKVISLIFPELAQKTKHVSHGMVRLPSGKMSSRTGDVITGESLLSEAYKKAWMKIQEVTKTDFKGEYAYFSPDAKIQPSRQFSIAEQVGVGAVKYALLKSNIGSDVTFNFEESISFEGNAGPYLQYTFVRTQSLLKKVGVASSQLQNSNLEFENEELVLMRLLARFENTVQQSAEKFAPNILCNYLFELAQAFNLFYQKLPILKAEDESRKVRLALTAATGNVIKKGLYLLGIDSPERM